MLVTVLLVPADGCALLTRMGPEPTEGEPGYAEWWKRFGGELEGYQGRMATRFAVGLDVALAQ